jgi:hypothetical protein
VIYNSSKMYGSSVLIIGLGIWHGFEIYNMAITDLEE